MRGNENQRTAGKSTDARMSEATAEAPSLDGSNVLDSAVAVSSGSLTFCLLLPRST
jgi:hypothetical protein